MHAAWLVLADIGGDGQGREKMLLRFYICRMLYSGGGGGLLWEFWGGDVPLGQWNPYPIPGQGQLNFATLY